MYLAVDIGGTKTLVAAFSERGRVVKKLKFPTALKAEDFLIDLDEALSKFVKYRVQAIAVAIPGVVRDDYWVHFGKRDWDGIDIHGCIKNLFNCPIYFENDANLAAVYESWRLKGKTMFLTFSTGLGGGIAENGRLLPESRDFEPGEREYVCGGERAQWQNIAAASALEKYFGVKSATDLRGTEAMREISARVALGLPDLVAEYRPRTIVLGGPLGKIFKLYVKYLPKFSGVRYRRPRRPLESVIYGCYLTAKRQSAAGSAWQKGRE